MKAILKLFPIVAVIGVLAVYRLLPHPWNFTPVMATAIVGGLYLNRWVAVVLPLGAMFAADLVLGLDWVVTPSIYLSILIAVWLGQWVARKRESGVRFVGYVGGSTLAASIVFFLLSNFAVWLSSGLYPLTGEGLVTCYGMAIPFFGNSVLGDGIFTLVLVGAYETLARVQARVPSAG